MKKLIIIGLIVAATFATQARAIDLTWYWPLARAYHRTHATVCIGTDRAIHANGRWMWHRFLCRMPSGKVRDVWVTGYSTYRTSRPVSPDKWHP